MAQVNKDVLWSSMFGQYVPIPQHEKSDGTMVPTGANNPLPVTGELKLSGSNVKRAAVLNVTTAGTRVRLPDVPCAQVMIIAKEENTAPIYVGLNDVSQTVYGAKLKPEASIVLPCTNANELYVVSYVTGEGVSYVAV